MQKIEPPPGIDLKKWGPTLLPDGKFYIFKGETLSVPGDWKNPQAMMEQLKNVEQFELRVSLPEERKKLFDRQLEILTKDFL